MTNDVMVLALHIAYVVIDWMVIGTKMIGIIIGARGVAMNAWHAAVERMQSAIDVRLRATNSNVTQPNDGHRNHAVTFSHLIFVFQQAIDHLRSPAGILRY